MKKTCLYDKHVQLGALMSPFAGYDMPIQYTNIVDEHMAVRQTCGIFDVSHMGEVTVKGEDAEKYVNNIFTNDVTDAPIGQVYYGMMCYEDGGTVDDLLVYKIAENDFLLVINAANIEKDWDWIQKQKNDYSVELENVSDYYGQLAIQGPEAESVMEDVLNIDCKDLKFYTAKTINHGETVVCSRTGYTGEDGFEIYGSHGYIRSQWDKLMESGRCKPCGLGCRDTLRFEVGLPLYGDELSGEISPVMAGLSIFCKFDKPQFIGKDTLLKQKQEGTAQRLVGIELKDRAIPRHGYPVMYNGEIVGEVTTGYHTISTDKSVCMALVNSECSKLGTQLDIQIRKKIFPGIVVKKKFYDKHYRK